MALWQWAIRKHAESRYRARACTGTITTLWSIAMLAEDILSVVDSGQVSVRYFVRIGVTRNPCARDRYGLDHWLYLQFF